MRGLGSDFQFGRNSTAEEVTQGIDLGGKVALVTGASGGLGAESARVLASRGARVILTAREAAKGEAVAQAIRAAHGDDAARLVELELESPDGIRAFAKQILSEEDAVHILINNAGVMACPLLRTARGFERQFATNHLGHFLLTCLLAPALRKGTPARVVSVSSAGHRFSPVVFEDIQFERRRYDKWAAYGQSKTANVLFAVELDRRFGSAGVHANAVHPGAIVTDLGRHLSKEDVETMDARSPGGRMQFKSIPQGAATQVFAATSPTLAGRGGLYLEDCQVAPIKRSESDTRGVSPYAVDAEAAKRLWEISERMVGEHFELR